MPAPPAQPKKNHRQEEKCFQDSQKSVCTEVNHSVRIKHREEAATTACGASAMLHVPASQVCHKKGFVGLTLSVCFCRSSPQGTAQHWASPTAAGTTSPVLNSNTLLRTIGFTLSFRSTKKLKSELSSCRGTDIYLNALSPWAQAEGKLRQLQCF